MSMEQSAGKGKKMKFQRYIKNLKYDNEGIYRNNTKIANLDFRNTTVQRLPLRDGHFRISIRF